MPNAFAGGSARLTIPTHPSTLDLKQLCCSKIAEDSRGELAIRSLQGWAAGIEIFELQDVLYVPEFGLPVWNGRVPVEAINYEGHLEIRVRQAVDSRAGGPFVDLSELDKSKREVCILGNIYSKNFGHWMEELLKVTLLEQFGFDGPYVFPSWYPSFCHDALALLGISPDRILLVDKPVVYKAAFFTTTVSHFKAHLFPAVFRHLRDRLYEAAGAGGASTAERIWVDRGLQANNGRSIVNEEEVQSFVESHGFQRVDFGRLCFRDQILLDRGMEVLMGPHGSAFVHCGFMQDGREVIEIFSPHYINPSVIQLCRALEHFYQQVVPTNAWHTPYEHGRNLMIDMDQLELAMTCFERRRAC